MPESPRRPLKPNTPRPGQAAPASLPTSVPAPVPAPAAGATRAQVNLDRCRLSLIKGEHRWRFRWQPGSEAAVISAVADLARNPRMNFDWFDAAVVCRHIAQGLPGRAASNEPPATLPASAASAPPSSSPAHDNQK